MTDLNLILRILSAPGTELVLPVIAPRPVLDAGNRLGVLAPVGRDPIAARRRDMEGLFVVVGSASTPGVPANFALRG